MSTFQTEPAKREPRWAHRYVVHGLLVDDWVAEVSPSMWLAEVAGEATLTITLTVQDAGSVGNPIDNVRLVRIG